MEKTQSNKIKDSRMKGVILAGGLGTRLHPTTKITNKHLLPVYDKPMILYPLETLKRSGITDIMVICGREHAGHFMNFLGSGQEYGVKLSFAIQDKNNGGIADALKYAEDFADEQSIAVILGDNIFEDTFLEDVSSFKKGARVFFKEVANPSRFGVPVFHKKTGRITEIQEKPAVPKSSLAQTGFYIYDKEVFKMLKKIKPSGRGELEITDVNNMYLKKQNLSYSTIAGFWSDAGTFASLLHASNYMASK
jgi:glucose-1-phosphate thymidylyltransferase